jgi:parallel beta-helix repeat protein
MATTKLFGAPADVRAFGAKGDGVTNDTVAFAAALVEKRSVYVPPTTSGFVVDNLTVPASSRLFGDGDASLIKSPPTSINRLLLVGGNNVLIEGLNILGNSASQQSASSGPLIEAGVVSDLVIRDNLIRNAPRHAIALNGSNGVLVQGNRIFNQYHGAGVLCSATLVSSNISVVGNHIRDSQWANVHSFGGVTEWIIADNILDGSGRGSGSLVGGEIADNITSYLDVVDNVNVTISGNVLKRSRNNGIHINGINLTIVGNVVEDPLQHGIFVAGGGEPPRDSFGVTVANNVVRYATVGTQRGILVRNTRTGTVTGNVLRNCYDGIELQGSSASSAQVDGITIMGNSYEGGTHFGVWFRDYVKNTIVVGNSFDFGGAAAQVFRPDFGASGLTLTDQVIGLNRIVDGANEAGNLTMGYADTAATIPAILVKASSANVDLALVPKGTGAVRFGTLTANADAAVTGYITVKDAGGTTRKLAVIT